MEAKTQSEQNRAHNQIKGPVCFDQSEKKAVLVGVSFWCFPTHLWSDEHALPPPSLIPFLRRRGVGGGSGVALGGHLA